MQKISKKMVSLFLAVLTLCSCFTFTKVNVEAATKSCGYIVNVYDGGCNYSGRYQCEYKSDFGKIGILGKKVKIEFNNVSSQLNSNQVNFYKNYARFYVIVSSNGVVKKAYDALKIGDKFTIPSGKNMSVYIFSKIDSSGWNEFGKQMKNGLPWAFAQYRLKY